MTKSEQSTLSTLGPLNQNSIMGDKNGSRKGRFKSKNGIDGPKSPLSTNELYKDIYQGMYDDIDHMDNTKEIERDSLAAKNKKLQIDKIYKDRNTFDFNSQEPK